MARYIDADKIPYYLDTSEEAPIEGRQIAFKSDIEKIPTADVAPRAEVAREIFEEIEENAIEHDMFGRTLLFIGQGTLDELKKKYAEGG